MTAVTRLNNARFFIPFIVLILMACNNTVSPVTEKSSSGISALSSNESSSSFSNPSTSLSSSSFSESSSSVLSSSITENETLNGVEVSSDDVIRDLFDGGQSNVQVLAKGTIIRILSDDLEGSQHQRFIIELESGQTILIAHNIDLAPRLVNITTNSQVYVYGEYEHNNEGGVIHWTHHDPDGIHLDGWIYYEGEYYG